METQLSIPLSLIKEVKGLVVKKLNCKDEFELHKTFEGLVYYRKHLKYILALYHSQRLFDLTLLQPTNKLNYQKSFSLNGKEHEVLVFDNEDSLRVNQKGNISYVVFHVFNNYRFIKFLGTITSSDINGNQISLNQVQEIIKNK